MPALSQRQFRAMEAAKHGNSTLGIPQDVGAEFADATPNPPALPKRVSPTAARAGVMRRKRVQP